ncbi:hypothetical protein E3O44_02265 [Cryobacterium algoricola]|uniref:MarR family transcriptional regulator n=1 Tax=Cryobacterium algoricola TaxID=1259183 RepID=A0ABY2IHX4_9MICO|nr:hypothetical protein [Cryobacterium algoricola]TFB90459.1 hypothetical protein E3O44_02265 [Cryobacterium algoricola]
MTTLDSRIREGLLEAGIPAELVTELLIAFAEAKRRFYRNDLRPSEIEGARFSEAVFRILQWATAEQYTALGRTLPSVDAMMNTLINAASNDSIRMHIPRTLRLIYDVRNKRDVAHLSDGIDPNQQDATLVVRNMEWVLAELVRMYNNVTAAVAHTMIVDLVSKDVPLIQEFDGFPRVLKQLRASDHVLVLLYWRGSQGATLDELQAWARAPMRANMKRTLKSLNDRDLLHLNHDRYVLTHLGEDDVETRKVLEPQ